MSNTLPRKERLKSRTCIDTLFKEGKGGFVYPLRYVFLEEDLLLENASLSAQGEIAMEVKGVEVSDSGTEIVACDSGSVKMARPNHDAGVMILVSASKRNHKRANVRNLIKRRMREAYRLNKSDLTADYVQQGRRMSLGLLYTSNDVLDYAVIENAVKKIIRILAERNRKTAAGGLS